MLISYPILSLHIGSATDEDERLQRMLEHELLTEGTYPVSHDRRWHGGIHLNTRGEPLRAIADATVVCFRVPGRTEDYLGQGPYDTGFVLLKHETETGEATPVVFYSLYMHLRPLSQLTPSQRAALPAFLREAATDTVIRGDSLPAPQRKVWRKDILGYGGQLYGRRDRCHLEVFTTDEHLNRFWRDSNLVAAGFPGHADWYGDTYYKIPAGRPFVARPPAARSDAERACFPELQSGWNVGALFVRVRLHRGDQNVTVPDYELRLLANAKPRSDSRCDPPLVSAIRLYRGSHVVQQLDTESRGACYIFQPIWEDMNFDGHQDLAIALALPAGPNIPYQSWLYDPATKRFVDAPATLQDITSPSFDAKHRIVYSYWRDGAASHGVATYRWNNGDLIEVDQKESYLLPIQKGGKYGLLYVMPGYVDGRIEDSPRLVQAKDGRIELKPSYTDTELLGELSNEIDLSDPRVRIEVTRQERKGDHAEQHQLEWVRVKTPFGERWCPNVPYFDSDRGRIGRHLVKSGNGQFCSEERPADSDGK